MMNKEAVDTIIELDKRIKSATNNVYNSCVVETIYDPFLGHIFGEIELTIFDLLLVAILSQVHVLITGPTGHAKSALAKIICRCVFGNENKGSDEENGGWYLERLSPDLTLEDFTNFKPKELNEDGKTLRDAVKPARLLSLPCTILDELNRCPAVLTNRLLGFCDPDDPEMKLLCGVKYKVGYRYENAQGIEKRYHLVIGTMNEGKEYSGIFDLDPALHRRFTLEIPFGDLRPTPKDSMDHIENLNSQADEIYYDNMIDQITAISDIIIRLPLQPLATIYLAYLSNVGRCPNSPSGFHPEQSSQELCSRFECRIQKIADSFCPSVSGFSFGLIKVLTHAACGLTALRAARTVESVNKVCEGKESKQVAQLREFTNTNADGNDLRDAVVTQYLKTLLVTADDIKAMVPFVGLGKVWIADEYIAKHFAGSSLQAMKNYKRLTYSWLENFFRQYQMLINQLGNGNGTIDTIKRRLEHAERFNDPFIRHTIEPLLDKNFSMSRNGEEVAEEIIGEEPLQNCAKALIGKH